jgi:hypothetical protein
MAMNETDSPAPSNRRVLSSMDEVREVVPAVLERINGDQRLATAALANPVMALEELGYELSSELRPAIVRRARFSRRDHDRLVELSDQIDGAAGRHVAPAERADLERLIFEELQLPRPNEYDREPPQAAGAGRPDAKTGEPVQQAERQHREPPRPLHRRPPRPWRDPLEELRGRHPVMEPLLAYRALDAQRPPLADAELYAAVRAGRVSTPVTRIRGRLQEDVA